MGLILQQHSHIPLFGNEELSIEQIWIHFKASLSYSQLLGNEELSMVLIWDWV